jgi:hypothetical protein
VSRGIRQARLIATGSPDRAAALVVHPRYDIDARNVRTPRAALRTRRSPVL